MRLVGKFEESKNPSAGIGEDRLIIAPNFVAVIDGATSKSGRKIGGKTTGAYVADLIGESIKEFPPVLDAFQAVARVTEIVRSGFERDMPELFDPEFKDDRPCASVVIYSDEKRQIWRVGDCLFSVDGGPTIPGKKLIDQFHAERRAEVNREFLRQNPDKSDDLRTRDIGREAILDSLKTQHQYMNLDSDHKFAFGAIDGRTVPQRFIEVHDVSTAKRIMLASDGVLEDLRSFEDPHFNMMQVLEQQLRYYEHDPYMIGLHKATKGLMSGQKWGDDIAVAEIRLGYKP
jgi:glycerophosphoryl diester phosphodiesterase